MSFIPTRLRRVFGQEPLEPELLLTPEMEADRIATFSPIGGMTRLPDHKTSMAAAAVVETQHKTLKAIVLQFAKDAGPAGFIDESLADEIDPTRPESSFRKRRTELAAMNWILDTGLTRRNSHGQESKVWVHREHFFGFIPPLVSAPKKRKLSAADERAKIVAYIEKCSRQYGPGMQGQSLQAVASDIKRGDHLK